MTVGAIVMAMPRMAEMPPQIVVDERAGLGVTVLIVVFTGTDIFGKVCTFKLPVGAGKVSTGSAAGAVSCATIPVKLLMKASSAAFSMTIGSAAICAA